MKMTSHENIIGELLSGPYSGKGWYSEPDTCGDAPAGMKVGEIKTTTDGRIFARLGKEDEIASCGLDCCGIMWHCHREVFIET